MSDKTRIHLFIAAVAVVGLFTHQAERVVHFVGLVAAMTLLWCALLTPLALLERAYRHLGQPVDDFSWYLEGLSQA